MGFGVPWGFLWFLGWGVVLLLYFLQRRFRRVEVSALFLWERIPEHPLSFRERLRALWDLVLFLQLLGVGLLGVAFAEPQARRAVPAGSVALILDGSASMGAADRPEEVKEVAAEVVRTSAGPWAVVLWADPPRYLVPPTGDRAAVLRGISRYAPTYGRRCSLGDALAFLPGQWDRVVIITDFPPEEAEGFEVVALRPVEDLALTAFSLRSSPQGSGYEAYVAVRNGTAESKTVPVVVRVGEYTFRERIQVPPGGERGLSFPYFGPTDVGIVARIEADDPFPTDDVRYFSFGFRRPRRGRWVGEEDRFLRAAILASEPVVFVETPPWDFTVAVRTELGEVNGPTLLWESTAPGIAFGEPAWEGEWRAEDERLSRILDLTRWERVGVYAVEPPGDARVLIRRGPVPAAFVTETPGYRVAVAALAFAGAEEVLLSPDFPLFVHHLLAYILPPMPKGTYEVGEMVELPPGMTLVQGGREVEGSLILTAPGIYRVRTEDGLAFPLAVNLPREECVPPGGTTGARRSPVPIGGAAAMAEYPLWRFWAWALLGVLLVEGALALRRW